MLEEMANLLLPVDLLKNGPHDPESFRLLAAFKRLVDIWRLDADFREAWRLDPEKAIADTGLDIEPEAFRLYLHPAEAEKLLREHGAEALPKSCLLYLSALREREELHKLQWEKLNVPDEPHLRAWRARQDRRCRRQIGTSQFSMTQFPLAFELSEGCSVGCPFCGFAAKGLRGIFRYTDENALLWRETLRRLHALIGDAAGYGLCYYATEPLDNPDYERFLDDWRLEFGVMPQTTTAASARDIDRTRALLVSNQASASYYLRFSVLSPAMRDKLFTAFTPEELVGVIMLPQFPEAPGSELLPAGHNRGQKETGFVGSTIACVSGFIVNMQDKTVRLETPYASDRSHPTGEWILEKCAFSTAGDLEKQIRRMILQYMPENLDLQRQCGASCDFRLEEKDGEVWAFIREHGSVIMNATIGPAALDTLSKALKQRRYTGGELLDLLPEDTDFMTGFLLLNMLWHHGLIDQIMEYA